MFKKEHGEKIIGQISVGSCVGGMRGLNAMLYETSKLHPLRGINYRGKDLYEIRDKAPRAPGGSEPLIEGVLWLLLTGQFPDAQETEAFRAELFARGKLSEETEKLIRSFPKNMHPMTQLQMGILAC